jgi:hypothetical protein
VAKINNDNKGISHITTGLSIIMKRISIKRNANISRRPKFGGIKYAAGAVKHDKYKRIKKNKNIFRSSFVFCITIPR